MLTKEKVAYLKGLADGLELGQDTKQDKLIAAIIDVLDCVASDFDSVEQAVTDLAEELDAVSDDLADVEDIIYGEDDDVCRCEDEEEDDECCCGNDGHEHEGCCCGGNGEHERENGSCCCGGHHGELYSVTCPACGKELTIDESAFEKGSFECPHCGTALEFDFGGDAPDEAPCKDEK